MQHFREHMPSILSYYSNIVQRIDGSTNDPLITFDNICQVLEGKAYIGRRLAQGVVMKSYEVGNASTLIHTIAQYFEHSRWRMLYQKHLKTVAPQGRPQMIVKAQTIWLMQEVNPATLVNRRLRLEAWIEHFKTMSVTTGHCLIDPSNSQMIALASIAIATKARGVLPNRPQLEDLVDKDTRLPQMDESYNRLCCTIDTSLEPIVSLPFMLTPADLDALGEVNQSQFIRYFEGARYQSYLQLEHTVENLPPPSVLSLEYLTPPPVGATVQVLLWGDTFEPATRWSGGDVLMELRDVKSDAVYTRCSIEVGSDEGANDNHEESTTSKL